MIILIALTPGITIIISRMMLARLSEKLGNHSSTLINYVFGILVLFILYPFIGNGFDMKSMKDINTLHYLGGALGVLTIMISNFIAPKLSALKMTVMIFLGQIGMGLIIDSLMGENIGTLKLVGALFVFCGLLLNIYLDKSLVMSKLK
jgi:transporter family-2 protein